MEVIDTNIIKALSTHFKHTAEFLQLSFYWPRVAAQALIQHVSNEN